MSERIALRWLGTVKEGGQWRLRWGWFPEVSPGGLEPGLGLDRAKANLEWAVDREIHPRGLLRIVKRTTKTEVVLPACIDKLQRKVAADANRQAHYFDAAERRARKQQ